MAKKRKLNSKNPKYWSEDKKEEPIIKNKILINPKSKHKVYALFLENSL